MPDGAPRPLRAAMIGLGMVAPTHAKAIAATAGRVVLDAVCSRSRERARAFADGLDGDVPRVLPDASAVAADPMIDLAIVCTPPDARAEIVAPLADAGKPILMEKPIERTLEAAEAIVRRCERAGVPLGLVLQHRMRPGALAMREVLASGEIGEIATVEIAVPWWRQQSYYDEPGRGTFARDGGGVLISQAIHTIDLALYLAGPAARVQAMLRTSRLHEMEAEDFAVIGLDLASGAVGSIVATTASYPGAVESITINGTRGTARLVANELTVRTHDGAERTIGEASGTGGGADPMAFTHEWHQAVIEDFARVVREGGEPVASGRSALAVHRLIDAAVRSSREGRAVEVE